MRSWPTLLLPAGVPRPLSQAPRIRPTLSPRLTRPALILSLPSIAGNNTPGKIIDMEAGYFEQSWRVVCFGGFLFGREAVRRLVPKGAGTLLFTGASASLRGRSGYGAVNSSKAGPRTLAQAMAKEYAADGIHVGHVVVDGPIGGEKIMKGFPDASSSEERLIIIAGIVDGFIFLHKQPRRAWSFELDVRTSQENW